MINFLIRDRLVLSRFIIISLFFRELSKHESMWMEQQGEATSTVERIKYMQEELQNCK